MRLNGKEVTQEELDQRLPDHECHFGRECWCGAPVEADLASSHGQTTWPLHSDALGVHPSQIPEAMEQAKRLGVPTNFDPLGRAICTSQAHQDQLAKALGMSDRSKKLFHKHHKRLDSESVDGQDRSKVYSFG